jgi:hypothetical protein
MSVKAAGGSGLVMSTRRNAGVGSSPILVGEFSSSSTNLGAWSHTSQADDLLIVWSASYDSGYYATSVTSAGLTFNACNPNSTGYMRAFYAWLPDATQRSVSYTWTNTGSWLMTFGAIFRGVDTTTPFDVVGSESGTFSTINGVTTVTPFSLAYGSACHGGLTDNTISTSGWTEGGAFSDAGHNMSFMTARKVIGTAGATGDISLTNTGGNTGANRLFILRPKQ